MATTSKMIRTASVCVAGLLLTAVLGAQGTVLVPLQGTVPVTNRLPATTHQGTIVEISCFRAKGAATVATPDQIACAKAAVAKNTGVIAILTEGDGLFKVVGNLTANNYARFVPFIGQRVELSGSEVVISNNYDYHAFDAKTISPAKK